MAMNLTGASALSLGIRLTRAERRAGRLLRAPDHDASTGGGDNGNAGNDDAGSGSGEGAGSGEAAGAAGGGGEGQSQDGGSADGGAGDAGDGGDGSSILGDAVREGDGSDKGSGEGDGSGDGEGKDGQGDGGDKGGDDPGLTFKPSEDADPVPILGAPEAYDVKVPDALAEAGITFDKEVFDLVEPVIRDLNLSNDAAQALVSAYAEKVLPVFEKRANDQAEQIGADMRKGWADESKALFDGKEGRETLDAAKALSKQAFVRLGVKGDSPLVKLLDESGLGSHPDMLTAFAAIGRMLGEAPVNPTAGGDLPQRTADKVYGKPIPRE